MTDTDNHGPRYPSGARRAARRALVVLRRGLWLAPFLLIAGCGFSQHGFLAAAGPVAQTERGHFFSIIGWTLIVIVPLFVALPIVLWKYRLGKKSSTYRPQWTFSWTLEILIWGIPLVIVGILGYNLWTVSQKLDPYKPIPSNRPPVEIRVVSMDWKWLFIYPQQHIAAVNKLVLPVGRPVSFKLTSATVMQSFFIPRLGSQIYTMPGMVTQLHLLGTTPGTYSGENTQYNGKGFAEEKFKAHVVSEAAFKKWVGKVKDARPPLDMARYRKLAQPSVVPTPVTFGAVPAPLFQRIIAMTKNTPASQLPVAEPKSEEKQKQEEKRLQQHRLEFQQAHGA